MHTPFNDPLTALASAGLLVLLAVIAIMGRYMATHYTRVPGGQWTTWEKAIGGAPEREERAA